MLRAHHMSLTLETSRKHDTSYNVSKTVVSSISYMECPQREDKCNVFHLISRPILLCCPLLLTFSICTTCDFCLILLTSNGFVFLSKTSAVNLINVLREELCSHSETTSMQPEDSRTHSRRVVFFHQDNWRGNSAETNGPSFFGQSAVALSDKSVAWLDQTSMSLPFDPPDTLEKCVSKGLLDGDTGTRPLIGKQKEHHIHIYSKLYNRTFQFIQCHCQ